jgi:hypothetical protein
MRIATLPFGGGSDRPHGTAPFAELSLVEFEQTCLLARVGPLFACPSLCTYVSTIADAGQRGGVNSRQEKTLSC